MGSDLRSCDTRAVLFCDQIVRACEFPARPQPYPPRVASAADPEASRPVNSGRRAVFSQFFNEFE